MAARRSARPPQAGQPLAQSAPARVLVIEDNLEVRQAITTVLQGEGYEVTGCRSDNGALKLAAEWRPDVITVDAGPQMPPGRALLQELKRSSATHRIPVVVVTAFADQADPVQSLADAVVSKPFVLDELLGSLRQAVARRRQSPGRQASASSGSTPWDTACTKS